MKVLCLRSEERSLENQEKGPAPLKVGKEYVVLIVAAGLKNGVVFYILSEIPDKVIWVTAENFEIISQHIPSSWVSTEMQVCGDSVLAMLPESWNYENFFPELYEGINEVIDLFEKEVKDMYKEEGETVNFFPNAPP